MPSMVSTERSRLRISACQLWEISSLRNTQPVELPDIYLSIGNYIEETRIRHWF
jgi:hypothetical protein